LGLSEVFFGRKKRLEVYVAELEKEEREQLSDFLHLALKVDVSVSGGKVSVDSEGLSLEELRKLVNKFVYHRNLNRKYWVAAEGGGVRISRFEKAKKREKRRNEATPPQTITHGW
jgi:hypothetical protein